MHPPQNVWTAGISENQSQTQSIATFSYISWCPGWEAISGHTLL